MQLNMNCMYLRLPTGIKRSFTRNRLIAGIVGLLRFLMIVGICFVIIWPVIWMVHYSFIELRDTRDLSIVYLPKHWTLENLKTAFEFLNYPKAFLNTVILVLSVTLLQVASCNLIGYGLARFKFIGSKLILALVIFVLVVPPQTIMVPIYLYYRSVDIFGLIKMIRGTSGILDTYLPFWLQAITGFGIKNSLYILIFMQMYKGSPKAIEEAAMVDGASVPKTYVSIMLPGSKAGIVTVFLFSVVWQWNDSYYVSMFLNQTNVLSNKLASLSQNILVANGGIEADPMLSTLYNNAGTLLCVLPLIILYCFLQKQFVESIENTGIVG